MKKAMIISALAALVLSVNGVYAQSSGTVKSAVKAKSPWSAKAYLETTRAATGKPQDGFSNLMFLQVGRSVLENTLPGVSVALRLYGSNKFKTDLKETGLRRYFSFIEPTLLLTKANLFKVAGVEASAQTRYYTPLTREALEDSRNPHRGHVRQLVSFERAFGPLTVGYDVLGQFYNYKYEAKKDGKANDRWRLGNSLRASYQLKDGVSLNSSLDFDNRWKQVVNTTASTLDWSNTVAFSPMENLTVEAGLNMSAPNQSLKKFWNARLKNTSAQLGLTYKFL